MQTVPRRKYISASEDDCVMTAEGLKRLTLTDQSLIQI